METTGDAVEVGARGASSSTVGSLSDLKEYVMEAAELTTAIVAKAGRKRGGGKMKAERRELMSRKVTLVSGDTGKQLLPSR